MFFKHQPPGLVLGEEARAPSPQKAKLFEPPLHAAASPISTAGVSHQPSSLLSRFGVIVALSLHASGCSFVFVTPPPAHVSQPVPHPQVDCTSSRVAPVLDGILTGYELLRVGYAAQASSGDYSRSPIGRDADIALGAGFAALFLTSTIYGIVNTSACQRLKEGPALDEEMPGITREPPDAATTPEPPLPAKSSVDQFWDAGTRPDVPPAPTAAPAAASSASPPEPAPSAPVPSPAPPAGSFPAP